jgi:predicted sulfurtransferase
MGKILIYYKYVDITDPEQFAIEQRNLCQELGLKGRILIAHEGINATVGGPDESADRYKEYMLAHPLFSDVDFKESEGEAEHFPRLMVKVKKEIVNLRLDTQRVCAKDGGIHLSPQEVHALIAEKPNDLIILDARNSYESRVGSFENALKPDIDNFRDLPGYIDEHLDEFKDKQVLMYCTAGVRTERATAYLKIKNVAKQVYQIRGGIQRYVEAYPDGFFRGKNYVFDGRVTAPVTDDILAQCEQCKIPYDEYSNCINAECNKQIIVCPKCIEIFHNTCSQLCNDLVQGSKVNIRTLPHKILIRAQNR